MSDVEEPSSNNVGFDSFGLDDRLVKAIAQLGWPKPTLIQQKAIPLALQGLDILARARTGSGKTGAFAIPVLQKVLELKQISDVQCIRCLVLVPTKELSVQITKHFNDLCRCCSRDILITDLAMREDGDSSTIFAFQPDIVVGTPSRVLNLLTTDQFSNSLEDSLKFFVIDEADLVFSLGYEEDTKAIIGLLPTVYQCFLTSATLSDEVKALKKLVLRNAVTLKLEEAQLPTASQLTQYYIQCPDDDKYVLMYALLKLGLIRGKTLIFVNSVTRCYKLKLFLQQFGIVSCILNSELPANCRCHIVQQFNDGVYDYIIASDQAISQQEEGTSTSSSSVPVTKKKRTGPTNDPESGVSRGIDFHHVSNVINFDFPFDIDGYIHRVGRTARGWNQGTALSFSTSAKELKILGEVESMLESQGGGCMIRPYKFDMSELEGFRYRANDAWRAVTSTAIRETRLAEIKSEIFKSDKLKNYFSSNPRDMRVLRHDKSMHLVRQQPHLQCVPDYLVPEGLKGSRIITARATRKKSKNKGEETNLPGSKGSTKQRYFMKNKADPLKSFEVDDI